MASAASFLHLLTRSRGRSFFLPREHGAWGMRFLESPRPFRVHRLGVSELLYAIVFGMFFIVAYHPQSGWR